MEQPRPRPPAELIARAEEATRLLHGPVFADAYANARSLFISEWEKAESTDARELAWSKVQGLKEVQRQLRRIISQGEVAAHRQE